MPEMPIKSDHVRRVFHRGNVRFELLKFISFFCRTLYNDANIFVTFTRVHYYAPAPRVGASIDDARLTSI